MKDWAKERWRKLYLREALDQRLWSVMARGLRDYLIRLAEDDGPSSATRTIRSKRYCSRLAPMPTKPTWYGALSCCFDATAFYPAALGRCSCAICRRRKPGSHGRQRRPNRKHRLDPLR